MDDVSDVSYESDESYESDVSYILSAKIRKKQANFKAFSYFYLYARLIRSLMYIFTPQVAQARTSFTPIVPIVPIIPIALIAPIAPIAPIILTCRSQFTNGWTAVY